MAAIVIGEDEVLFRMVLADDLKAAGHTVSGLASTGPEAVSLAEQKNPDILLLDIHMASKTDGIDACIRLKKTLPGIKIILMSGYPESVYAPYLKDAAYDAYLEKIFSIEKLLTLISKLHG